jgi:hypothetical protein
MPVVQRGDYGGQAGITRGRFASLVIANFRAHDLKPVIGDEQDNRDNQDGEQLDA